MSTEYKGYIVANDETGWLKKIKYPGKGSIDLSLRGLYTTVAEAQRAIDSFLSTKKEKQNGDAVSAG